MTPLPETNLSSATSTPPPSPSRLSGLWRWIDPAALAWQSLITRVLAFPAWVVLALTLAIGAWPMVLNLDDRDTRRVMENVTLGSSQETWLVAHGVLPATYDAPMPNWAVPSWAGRPRTVKPPLMVWLHVAALSDLDPQTTPPRVVATRLRWVAAGLALLTVAGIFAIGVVLDGKAVGWLAASAALSLAFFTKYGRTAAYDTHLLAWTTLALAAGLWAMHPRRAVSLNACVGRWLLAGLALTAAVWTKGPVALVIVALPLALVAPLCLTYRRSAGVGLQPVTPGLRHTLPWGSWAWILGLSLVAWLSLRAMWYPMAEAADPGVHARLANEYAAERAESQPIWYYAGLLGLLMPWTFYVVAAVLFPWVVTRGRARVLTLIPWAWGVLLLAIFSLSPAKQQRYILPVLVPAVLVQLNF